MLTLELLLPIKAIEVAHEDSPEGLRQLNKGNAEKKLESSPDNQVTSIRKAYLFSSKMKCKCVSGNKAA